MFPDNLTEEEQEEIQNAVYDFMHYRASNMRFVMLCAGIIVGVILLLVWLIM